jgi:hypothetical protein
MCWLCDPAWRSETASWMTVDEALHAAENGHLVPLARLYERMMSSSLVIGRIELLPVPSEWVRKRLTPSFSPGWLHLPVEDTLAAASPAPLAMPPRRTLRRRMQLA